MALLEMKEVVKRFGGLTAVDHLNLQVEKSQIVGLIGPNGSGKTTALNCVTGVYKPEEGSILFDGKEIQGKMPHQICIAGIARTFQNIRVMGPLSVYDNVRLGLHIQTKANLFSIALGFPSVKKESRAIESVICEALDLVGLLDYKDELVRNLPYGKQKVMEIARAIVAKPKLLLLDEPAAGLNTVETAELSKVVRKISDTGVPTLLIEHEMAFVKALTNKVYVINYGKKIAEGTYDEIRKNPEVIQAYLGAEGE